MKGNLSNNYVGHGANQVTRSYGAKSNNRSSLAYWIIGGGGLLLSAAGFWYSIRQDAQKREDAKKKDDDRKTEKNEDRVYREQQKQKDYEYKEAQEKNKREYLHQQELEKRAYVEQLSEKNFQRRMEAAKASHQYKLEMQQLRVHASTQPTPIKSETLAEIGQEEIPSAEALRIVGDVIHSGERGIIFGATGQCKSILAWQIGINLALGESCGLFPTIPTRHAPMPVYIIDGEMSKVNVAGRYPKEFVPKLQNVHRLSGAAIGHENLIFQVKNIVEQTNEQECAIIIDNLMSICPNPTAKQICVLYDALKTIGEHADARGTKVTMIIVAHERKNKHYGNLREISIEDMYGSSYTGNFADFAIGIANTKDKEVKRIKIVKARLEKDHENIIIARKGTTPYLHLDYIKEVPEEEALSMDANDLQLKCLRQGDITIEVAKQMRAMYKRGVKGCGWDAIGLKFGVSGTAVKNAFKRYKLS